MGLVIDVRLSCGSVGFKQIKAQALFRNLASWLAAYCLERRPNCKWMIWNAIGRNCKHHVDDALHTKRTRDSTHNWLQFMWHQKNSTILNKYTQHTWIWGKSDSFIMSHYRVIMYWINYISNTFLELDVQYLWVSYIWIIKGKSYRETVAELRVNMKLASWLQTSQLWMVMSDFAEFMYDRAYSPCML